MEALFFGFAEKYADIQLKAAATKAARVTARRAHPQSPLRQCCCSNIKDDIFYKPSFSQTFLYIDQNSKSMRGLQSLVKCAGLKSVN